MSDPQDMSGSRELKALLLAIQSGDLSVEAGIDRLEASLAHTVHESDGLCLDTGRATRCGLPEVVYAPGKTPQAVRAAFEILRDAGQPCLATRVSPEQVAGVRERFPDVIVNELARTIRLPARARPPASSGSGSESAGSSSGPDGSASDRSGMAPDGGAPLPDQTARHHTDPAAAVTADPVFVVSAGTSDRPVAEEALETLRWAGCRAELILDIGVAGPQRLLRHVPRLRAAAAIVVVAGMEGALPSVVAGHVACPVFGVPASVGYGAAFGGVSALLSMLNSCAANVAVVNIDAGFKAGYLAALVVRGRRTEQSTG